MNLVDMARRGDKNLLLEADLVACGNGKWFPVKALLSHLKGNYIVASKRCFDGVLYRGFDLSAGERTRLVLKSPLAWYPFCLRPDATGWYIAALDRRAEGSRLAIRLRRCTTGDIIAEQSIAVTKSLSSLGFPLPFRSRVDPWDSDLELTFCDGTGSRAFLAVHRVLDRSEVIGLCQGRGIELGPGLQPQILPTGSCDVTYVEESSPEEWNRLYNEKGTLEIDQSLWSRYTIGRAFPLPAEDGSLDFIFSSHLFEHLANPLGHLEHWYAKLRQNGVIVGIVPDVGGSKDYVFEPCSIIDLLNEYAEGIVQPQLSHYRRWAVARAPGRDPAWYWKAKRSIHVHFYTLENMRALLEIAVKQLGFRSFRVWYTPNHKDFYFVVEK